MRRDAYGKRTRGTARSALVLGAALALAACAVEEKPHAASDGRSYAGWYMEHAGQGVFQRCGQSQQWRVSGSAEVGANARQFGLDPDTPVYVRLTGTLSTTGDELEVSRVEQFGSTTPVRDCALTGVVIPEPAPATD